MLVATTHRNPPLYRPFLLLLALSALLAAGCSARDDASGSVLRAKDGTAINPLQANDSGESLDNLKTFRGLFSISDKGGTLTLCDTDAPLRVQDRTDGGLVAVTREFAPLPGDIFFVEILGHGVTQPPFDRTKRQPDAKAKALVADMVAVEVTHASAVMESPGCREQFDTFRFKARGNEPGWTALAEPGRMSFNTMELGQPLRFRGVQETVDGDTTVYAAQGMRLTVTKGVCRDTMSGEWYGWRAEAEVDGARYAGCAIRGDL